MHRASLGSLVITRASLLLLIPLAPGSHSAHRIRLRSACARIDLPPRIALASKRVRLPRHHRGVAAEGRPSTAVPSPCRARTTTCSHAIAQLTTCIGSQPDDTHILIEGGPVDYFIFHPDGHAEKITLGMNLAGRGTAGGSGAGGVLEGAASCTTARATPSQRILCRRNSLRTASRSAQAKTG